MTHSSNVIPFAARAKKNLVKFANTPVTLVTIEGKSGLAERDGMEDKRSYSLPAIWEHAVQQWIAWLRIGGTRSTTLRLRRGHVRSIARRSGTQHPRELSLSTIVEICEDQTWSNEHRKGLRRSLISFFDFCVDRGLVSANPALALPRVAGEKPRPRPCPDDIWSELLAMSTPRVRMMARLAGEVGMRRAEVAVCRREDLVIDVDGWALIVHGKGGRQRVVPITDSVANEIREFCPRGYLFAGQIDGHISPDYVGRLLSRLMPSGWSMHKLRHRYATRGLAGTGNLIAVKEALGHASVATTQIYVAVASRDVRAVTEAAAGWTPRPRISPT
ncbi:tyrosine-type recombinase/integrase [Mycobacterium sp. PSTR-4-N]|uniref:tyrosine-type recombinase/integrase n=1 Tax=Mycobacterium sp. PSTR-4-N TaxID=2917745 RepID=UPI001F14EA95|nr:tyrosine-type recombinase/integrase [Mycobacterium sp. PSTR-4-N]MCG7595932.1 tyrosine-type recombinase/integrase [Mycobacterium sp. PSTR-4-N]